MALRAGRLLWEAFCIPCLQGWAKNVTFGRPLWRGRRKGFEDMRKSIFTRAVSLVLAMAVLLAIPAFAGAAATSGTTGQARWSYNSATRTLTFSGTGSTGNYNYFTGYGDTLHPYKDYLYEWKRDHATKVVVEAGITRLGNDFICGAKAVEEVVLPKTVTTIGSRAFALCEGLRTINIPVSVKTVETGAFAQCGYASGNTTDDGKGLVVNYEGTRAQWAQINFSSNNLTHALKNATINYLGEMPYPGTPFTDIASHWGKDVIKWVYEQKLFNGVSGTEFGPNQKMNRGMLVTVLHRMAGQPQLEGPWGYPFSDVDASLYYGTPVYWAQANEIVTGIGGGKFNPTGNVTREQLAKILYGYAVKFGKDTSSDPAALGKFSDASSISDWARAPMEWAATHGLLKGSNGKVNPKNYASRAEVAQIFYNCRDLLA